jgi:putative DNA methylase
MDTLTCEHCSVSFNPQKGRVDGQFIKDSEGEKHKIKDLFRDGKPPEHRLYAMMALRSNGEKVYLEPRAYDFELFKSVKQRLEQEDLPLPVMSVRPGHNTNQARGYNYRTWRDFFNERQLLSLGLLLRRILQIDDEVMKDQFLCLFSSTLEYSNLFSTFKGEGTGAVRHLFSHHILKPERTPLESSVWGTPKSSGAFSTLFRTRLMKAKEYLDTPTDIFLPKDFFGNSSGTKSSYVVTSDPIHLSVTNTWGEFDHQKNAALILNGDSANLSIPDKSVDAIVTDPPYVDFVHYSELSDFFFAWLAPVLAQRYSFFTHPNSYQEGEVQSKNPENFASNLSRVLRECHRVLKDEGVLTFSFHHSRAEGWSAIYKAIKDANLQVIATYPVHAEMKVASPKSSAKEPISLDMILVCKKKQVAINKLNTLELVESAVQMYKEKLQEGKFTISEADAFNIRAALLLIFAMGEDSSVQKYQDLTKKIHFKNQITSTNQLKSSTKVLETI